MSDLETCGHCGAPDVRSFDAGYARSAEGIALCNPNVRGRPLCYNLVTLYKVLGGGAL